MSRPVSGPLSVTPLYTTSADELVWWDGAEWWATEVGGGFGTVREYLYLPTSAQGVFSGVDYRGNVLALDIVSGETEVYLNGVKLLKGLDYSVTSDAVTLLLGSVGSPNTVEIVSLVDAVSPVGPAGPVGAPGAPGPPGPAGPAPPVVLVSGDATVGSGGYVLVSNTAGRAITLTLPAGLVPFVLIKDVAGNANLYPITVSFPGGLIDGNPTYTLALALQWLQLVWTGVGYAVVG